MQLFAFFQTLHLLCSVMFAFTMFLFVWTHTPYLFLLRLLCMLLLYAFTIPFLNKVFLELYTTILFMRVLIA